MYFISRKELIGKFRSLGFSGPFSDGSTHFPVGFNKNRLLYHPEIFIDFSPCHGRIK